LIYLFCLTGITPFYTISGELETIRRKKISFEKILIKNLDFTLVNINYDVSIKRGSDFNMETPDNELYINEIEGMNRSSIIIVGRWQKTEK